MLSRMASLFHRRPRRTVIAALICIATLLALGVYHQQTRKAVDDSGCALDRPVINFQLDEVTVPEAVAALNRNAHVDIHFDPAVVPATLRQRVWVRIKSGTVREALNAIVGIPGFHSSYDEPLLYAASGDRIDVSDREAPTVLRTYEVGDLLNRMVMLDRPSPYPGETPIQFAQFEIHQILYHFTEFPRSPLAYYEIGDTFTIDQRPVDQFKIAATLQALRAADLSPAGAETPIPRMRDGGRIYENSGNVSTDAAKEMLSRHIAKLHFDQVPFEACIHRIEEIAGVAISVSWEAGYPAVPRGDELKKVLVTLNAADITVAAAFDQIFEIAAPLRALRYAPLDGVIVIGDSPPWANDREQSWLWETRIYNVRDIESSITFKHVGHPEDGPLCGFVEGAVEPSMHANALKVMGLLIVNCRVQNHARIHAFLEELRKRAASGQHEYP